MDLTSGTRATTAAGATVMLGGLTATLHGILRNNQAHSVGGGALAMFGLAAIALILIHQWVTNTTDERRILAAALREAQSRKDTYLAAKAGLENEQGRLNRDVAAERASLAARLKAERDTMTAEFEEQRATLIAETMEATVLMIHDGKFTPAQSTTGRLIPFPDQQPVHQRARSRERGVVGP